MSPDYGTTPFSQQQARETMPTSGASNENARTNFRTTVVNIERPGDASVFGAKTRAEAKELISRYPKGQARSALLPMLHLVQSEQGWISPDGIAFCAEQLDITKAQVTAVATFYTMYKRHPTGEYLVSVCTNTLCGMMGGDEIFAAVSRDLGIENNATTDDGKITIERAECLAACDYAPIVTVNYEFYDNQTVGSTRELVSQLQNGERPMPTRGAPLCSFKQAERQIAGFFDDDFALEANGTGVATEVGVKLAIERRETAPSYAVDDRDRTGAGTSSVDTGATEGPSQSDAPLKTAESDEATTQEPGQTPGSGEPGSASSSGPKE